MSDDKQLLQTKTGSTFGSDFLFLFTFDSLEQEDLMEKKHTNCESCCSTSLLFC